MKECEIAKNILLERNCNNCIYSSKGMGILRCKKSGALDLFTFCPEENTCKNWKTAEQS